MNDGGISLSATNQDFYTRRNRSGGLRRTDSAIKLYLISMFELIINYKLKSAISLSTFPQEQDSYGTRKSYWVHDVAAQHYRHRFGCFV